MRFVYCVLAGGRSYRFGGDKRLSLLGNRRLIDYPITLLNRYGVPVYVSGRFNDELFGDIELIRDEEPFGGPLCGVYSVMKKVEADGYVFLSGDMPFVNKNMVDAIVETLESGSSAVMFECEGNWTPLPLGLSRRVFEFFKYQGCGNRRIKELIDSFGVDVLKWKTCTNLFNINTKYDLTVASVILGGADSAFERFLVYEKQMDIYLNNKKVAALNVTPVFLKELVHGYLYSSGYVGLNDEVSMVQEGLKLYAEVVPKAYIVGDKAVSLRPSVEMIKNAMIVFNNNIYLHSAVGGYHGGALFSEDGKLLFVNEDVSKYNTIDKCVGYALLNGIDLGKVLFVTSGRLTSLSMKKIVNSGIRFAVSGSNITKEAFDVAVGNGVGLGRYVNKKREEIIYGGTDG